MGRVTDGRSDGWSVAATELICTAKHILEEVKANSAPEELPYVDQQGHGMLIKYWDAYFNDICGVGWVGLVGAFHKACGYFSV